MPLKIFYTLQHAPIKFIFSHTLKIKVTPNKVTDPKNVFFISLSENFFRNHFPIPTDLMCSKIDNY